ncbi:PREDICTED: uncharacterized protein LOC106809882 [Priapulus caudatus]|uniref:Uncharacterized protein LOC106809882 n=1 Tax=Priapulus caudatus TaxID=37621 RepID=A0ABM1E8T3_PRICU|nr:PREDICTED: uncharacterized protein LOC106809882 [Priapulus caudatus]
MGNSWQLVVAVTLAYVCTSLVSGYSLYTDQKRAMIPRIHGRSESEAPRSGAPYDEPYIPRMIGRSSPDAASKRELPTVVRLGRTLDEEIWDLLQDYSVVIVSPQALADQIQSRNERSLDAERRK